MRAAYEWVRLVSQEADLPIQPATLRKEATEYADASVVRAHCVARPPRPDSVSRWGVYGDWPLFR